MYNTTIKAVNTLIAYAAVSYGTPGFEAASGFLK